MFSPRSQQICHVKDKQVNSAMMMAKKTVLLAAQPSQKRQEAPSNVNASQKSNAIAISHSHTQMSMHSHKQVHEGKEQQNYSIQQPAVLDRARYARSHNSHLSIFQHHHHRTTATSKPLILSCSSSS